MNVLYYFKNIITIAFQKPYNISSEEGRSKERQRRIALTAFTGIIAKAFSMLIPLITIKITLNYLGVEIYGLWNAVSTFFALFLFADLGLGNGLQTKLSQANGTDDMVLCRKLISSTYSLLTFFAIILFLIFVLIFNHIDWSMLMNATTNSAKSLVNGIVFIIVLAQIVSIPITIVQRTQLALQEGYISFIWSCIGSIFNLFFVVIITKLDLGCLILIGFSAFSMVLASGLNMIIYYRYNRKEFKPSIKFIDKTLIAELLRMGILFCIVSVLMTIGLSMDTFIVARNYSLSEAASYSIIYKISSIEAGIVGIITLPLWGVNGEAMVRGDYEWVKRNTKRMSYSLVIMTIIMAIIILFSSKFIFKVWLGENFSFSFGALIWLCILPIITSFVSPYFMVLNAAGLIKEQVLLYSIFTPICFLLKYFFSLKYDIFIIPFIGDICYLLILVPATIYYANKELNQERRNYNFVSEK
ncbi:MAG: oligosaccharide flippase family protein [Bacteroidales bacterium]|nr:oligosaccharide flippase family protein [Bacteroidales bacterium]